MEQTLNRREFKRVKLKVPTLSSIELVTPSINEEKRSFDPNIIFVTNISAGGLAFVSYTEFQVNFISLYKINIILKNKDLDLYGKIIRKKKLTNNLLEYGFKFIFN